MGEVRLDGALPRTSPVAFRAGLDLRQPFYDWMQSAFAGESRPRDGEIVGVDRAGAPVEASTFRGALMTEVGLPAFESDRNDVAHFSIRLTAESVKHERRAGRPKIGEDAATGDKTWLVSNFRFELGDLPCHRVTKIDGFVWKQDRSVELDVSMLDSAWEAWHRAFYIVDRSMPSPRDGRLIFLGPDGQDELGRIELHESSLSSLESETEKYRITLDAERIELLR